MPTNLGPTYSTKWRGHPPHMLSQDIPCWYRFVDKYGFMFKNLYLDCWVGGPWLTKEDEKDPIKRMWRANTSKRVDAIVEREKEVWLIEVATYPGHRSLGQLFAYQTLWLQDPKIPKMERLVLVCAGIDTDIAPTAAKFGVLIFVV